MTTALLVIDMQHALCNGREAAFGIGEVTAKVNALAARARATGAPVVIVQHEEPEGMLQFGSEGWALDAGVVTAPGDLRLRKTQPDAFEETGLNAMLGSLDVSRIVVCGLQTDCCVAATARRAPSLGYSVVLAADAHSTVDGACPASRMIDDLNRELRETPSKGAASIEVMPAAEIDFEARG